MSIESFCDSFYCTYTAYWKNVMYYHHHSWYPTTSPRHPVVKTSNRLPQQPVPKQRPVWEQIGWRDPLRPISWIGWILHRQSAIPEGGLHMSKLTVLLSSISISVRAGAWRRVCSSSFGCRNNLHWNVLQDLLGVKKLVHFDLLQEQSCANTLNHLTGWWIIPWSCTIWHSIGAPRDGRVLSIYEKHHQHANAWIVPSVRCDWPCRGKWW